MSTNLRAAAAAPAASTRCPQLRLSALLLIACSVGGVGGGPAHAQTAYAAERLEAVELGRRGDHAAALERLARLRAAAPDDAELLHDETTILGWAERDAAVLERADAIEPAAAPAFVLVTVAKAARNTGRFDMAVDWYRHALAADADDVDARSGLVLALADRGDIDAARRALAALPDADAATLPALLAGAYVEQRAGRPLPALTLYDDVLARAPGHTEALRGKALMLRALLLPRAALALADAHPGLLTDTEIARLRADAAALGVRLTAETPYPPGRDAPRAATLAAIERALATVDDPAARTALETDRIVALDAARRHADAVRAFEALAARNGVIEPYGLAAAANSYLAERQPLRAVALLERAVAAAPDTVDLRFALVFAYLEAARYDDALALARRLADELPLTRATPDGAVVKGDADGMRAEVTAALAEAYADQLAAAQTRLETLLAAAPHNADLGHELANVYRWRGWLDRARHQYREVLSSHPDVVNAVVGYLHTRLDDARFAEVEAAVAGLERTYPGNTLVADLKSRAALERRGALTVTAADGRSSGATFGSERVQYGARYTTQAFGRFRGIAAVSGASADFPEGRGELGRVGIGTAFRDGPWQAAGVVSRDRRGSDAIGFEATADWRRSDHWRLSARIDVNSAESPLRGRRVGIDTDIVGLAAEYRAHEAAAASVGWQLRDYDDGNTGRRWYANGFRRVVNAPRMKLDVTGELDLSTQATDQVPYFSPRRAMALVAGARHEWTLLARYEQRLVQGVALEAGSYRQAGFGSGGIQRLRYSLRFDASDALSVGLTAERTRMRYDGLPEDGTFVTLELTARL